MPGKDHFTWHPPFYGSFFITGSFNKKTPADLSAGAVVLYVMKIFRLYCQSQVLL